MDQIGAESIWRAIAPTPRDLPPDSIDEISSVVISDPIVETPHLGGAQLERSIKAPMARKEIAAALWI
jgi:hypothetical protein